MKYVEQNMRRTYSKVDSIRDASQALTEQQPHGSVTSIPIRS